MQCEVIQGDIAAQDADALVNAANTHLRMGSGVAGALRKAGGDELNDAAVSKGPVELGEVAVTDGYGLDADYVIHAASMPPNGRATAETIRFAARNSLRVADALGCASVVVPAIGCGVAGFDLAAGVDILAEEVRRFRPRRLTDVSLVAYGEDAYETMREAV